MKAAVCIAVAGCAAQAYTNFGPWGALGVTGLAVALAIVIWRRPGQRIAR